MGSSLHRLPPLSCPKEGPPTSITAGRNDMPAFGRVYEPADLQDVASHILEELAAE